MAKQTRNTLKGYFETGDIPTQGQYQDLIDSYVSLNDTEINPQIINTNFSASGAINTLSHITASGNISSSGTGIFNNVGIGLTDSSPDAKLEVAANGTTSQEIAHFGNSNGIGKIKLQLDGAGGGKLEMLDGSNNEDIVLDAHGNSYFNASHGNVGIGTSTPTEKLQITGNISNGKIFVDKLAVIKLSKYILVLLLLLIGDV